jgi:hypothetical protein
LDDLFDDLNDPFGDIAACGAGPWLVLPRTPNPVRFLPDPHQGNQAAAVAARGAAGGQVLFKTDEPVAQSHSWLLASRRLCSSRSRRAAHTIVTTWS